MQADLFFKGSKVFHTISSYCIFAINLFLMETEDQRLRGNPEPEEGKETHLTLCRVGRGSRRLSTPLSCPKQDQLQQAARDHDQFGGEYLQRCRLQMSPCSLFHYLGSLTIKKSFFLCLKGISCISVCALYVLSLGSAEKGLAHFVLHPLI